MNEIGLPVQFLNWVMLGVKTISYIYMVNGKLSDILIAKRGVRQGDPISSFLVVLVMEYLNRVLKKLQGYPDFNYHPRCENLNILNLSFADDLLLFNRGDLGSFQLMMNHFDEFSNATNLVADLAKCKVFFGGVNGETQEEILRRTCMDRGILPIRYLGVPVGQ